jgi:hypothetical protein
MLEPQRQCRSPTGASRTTEQCSTAAPDASDVGSPLGQVVAAQLVNAVGDVSRSCAERRRWRGVACGRRRPRDDGRRWRPRLIGRACERSCRKRDPVERRRHASPSCNARSAMRMRAMLVMAPDSPALLARTARRTRNVGPSCRTLPSDECMPVDHAVTRCAVAPWQAEGQ